MNFAIRVQTPSSTQTPRFTFGASRNLPYCPIDRRRKRSPAWHPLDKTKPFCYYWTVNNNCKRLGVCVVNKFITCLSYLSKRKPPSRRLLRFFFCFFFYFLTCKLLAAQLVTFKNDLVYQLTQTPGRRRGGRIVHPYTPMFPTVRFSLL